MAEKKIFSPDEAMDLFDVPMEDREEIKKITDKHNVNLSVPKFIYCTDNAAMIASAGYYNFINGERSDLTLNAVPNLKLG